MLVNRGKSKIMVFGTTGKPDFSIGGECLDIGPAYKYLGIEVSSNYRWSLAAKKRATGGLRAFYGMVKICKENNFENWSLRKLLFGALVKPVILYGCPAWAPGLSRADWARIEKVQKQFLLTELGVKAQTPYKMLLAETGFVPLELEALSQSLHYFTRVTAMDQDRLPHRALKMSQMKGNGWHSQVLKWAKQWDIEEFTWPEKLGDIQAFVQMKMVQKFWRTDDIKKEVKAQFYVNEVNILGEYCAQSYLGSDLNRKSRQLISQLRLSSHHLAIEVGRWQNIPQSDRLCPCCLAQPRVETEFHTFLECPSYDHIRQKFGISCKNLQELLGIVPRVLSAYVKQVYKERTEVIKLYEHMENLQKQGVFNFDD